jgi:hypothetical protein
MIGGIVRKKLSAAHSFGRPFIDEAGSSESKMRPQQGSAAGLIVAARTGAILVVFNGIGATGGLHPGVNGHAGFPSGNLEGVSPEPTRLFLIPVLCLAAIKSLLARCAASALLSFLTLEKACAHPAIPSWLSTKTRQSVQCCRSRENANLIRAIIEVLVEVR